MPVPYFPISKPSFDMTMNARAYNGPLIEVDVGYYVSEVALRRSIARSDPSYYEACSGSIELAMAWEALEIVLRDMAAHHPDVFILDVDGNAFHWRNKLLGEEAELTMDNLSSLPGDCDSPLSWLGGQVQEDLVLLRQEEDDPGHECRDEVLCAAGHVCFASGWSLAEKLGKSFGAVHADVPGFAAQIGMLSERLMRGLKPFRPVMRLNWTLAESEALNRTPRFRHLWFSKGAEITPDNAGERCYFRVEKQTLTRLPRTRGVLFTIHTYVNTLAEVCLDQSRANLLLGALKDMPEATAQYKGAGTYLPAVLVWLERSIDRWAP